MKKDNSKKLSDNQKIDRLIKLYKSYEKLKGFSDFVPKNPYHLLLSMNKSEALTLPNENIKEPEVLPLPEQQNLFGHTN